VSFVFRTLYPRTESTVRSMDRRIGWTHNRSRRGGEERYTLLLSPAGCLAKLLRITLKIVNKI